VAGSLNFTKNSTMEVR